MKAFFALIIIAAMSAIVVLYVNSNRSFKNPASLNATGTPIVSNNAPITASSTPAAENTNLEISTQPTEIIQGDPVMISLPGENLSDVSKIYLDGKSLWFFDYQNEPTAIIGIDLNEKAGSHLIRVELADGKILDKNLAVEERPKVEEPLGIPEKLGGNTPEAANNLVANLTKENVVINNVYSAPERFWSEKFIYPVANPIVTDAYGYLRETGYYTIPHKGADFHANDGTSVFAINRGVVRLAEQSTIYGKTIAIDHGFGVVSYYMHLSKINVAVGQIVKKGDAIALSGQTGYAEVPHLHLSIKINGISIDPVGFLDLFK